MLLDRYQVLAVCLCLLQSIYNFLWNQNTLIKHCWNQDTLKNNRLCNHLLTKINFSNILSLLSDWSKISIINQNIVALHFCNWKKVSFEGCSVLIIFKWKHKKIICSLKTWIRQDISIMVLCLAYYIWLIIVPVNYFLKAWF